MKNASDFQVYVIRKGIEDGMLSSEQSEYATNLGAKIKEYVLQIGYTNANVLTICTQLLQQGKVRVDFRNYTERLELVGEGEPSIEKIAMIFNQYIEELKKTGTDSGSSKMTQAIIVQPLTSLKAALKRKDPQ